MRILNSVETDETGRVIGIHTEPIEEEGPEIEKAETKSTAPGSQVARGERAKKKAKRKEAYKQRKQNRHR